MSSQSVIVPRPLFQSIELPPQQRHRTQAQGSRSDIRCASPEIYPVDCQTLSFFTHSAAHQCRGAFHISTNGDLTVVSCMPRILIFGLRMVRVRKICYHLSHMLSWKLQGKPASSVSCSITSSRLKLTGDQDSFGFCLSFS